MHAQAKWQNEDESVGCYVYRGLVHVVVNEQMESATVALSNEDVDSLIEALINARDLVADQPA